MPKTNPEVAALKAAVAEHLAESGGADWKALQARFPGVPHTTFWRCVRAVRAEAPDAEKLAAARDKIAERYAAEPEAGRREAVAANLPATPSPNFIAKGGVKGTRSIDLLGRLHELFADADLLRGCALAKDGAVRNPMIFAQSIALRERLVSSALKTLEAVYDLRYAEQFFMAVTDEVAAESPTTAGRIIARLKVLNAERGIAFDGPASI